MTTRIRLGALVLLAAAASGIGVLLIATPGRSRAATAPHVSTRGFPTGAGQPGIFTEACRFSHEAADDPILMPGRTGMAMHHDFFGNESTDASSTAASLRDGATSCNTSADSSAYWAPVLYQHGQALTPIRAFLYWERPRHMHETVHAMPVGLQMIAGDETATRPQGTRVVSWGCATRTGQGAGRNATPVSCPGHEHLKITITFPSCWNGHTLSADHTDDVVYPLSPRAGCPSSHPVLLPRLVMHLTYRTSSAADLSLSMSPTMTGSTDTAHADFINGWKESVLTADVNACINTETKCGPVRGPAATPQGPKNPD